MLLPRLVINQLFARKMRAILTIAAIALSVSLVVSVTTGYRSVLAMAHRFQDLYMGSADAQITRRDESRTEVPESIVWALRADPRVARATGRLEKESRVIDPRATTAPATQQSFADRMMPKMAHVVGLRRPDDTRIEQLAVVSGEWFGSSTGNVAVIDTALSSQQNYKVGDTIILPGINGKLELKVVGIVKKPGILASVMRSMYVPLETLQKFVAPEAPPTVTRISVDLQPGNDLQAFETEWKVKLEKIDPSLRLHLSRDSRQKLDENLQGVHLLSLMGGAVSLLAATFIVFSTLSMGVTERQRTLAMLRAIGGTRGQVARLVIIEAIFLGIIGVALGVPLGWLWVKILAWKFPAFFQAGVVLDPAGVIFGGAGPVLAAVVASLLPAWSATRISPLEAMNPLAVGHSTRLPIKSAILGLLLVLIDPIFIWAGWSRDVVLYGHLILGLPSLMVGYFLLAPMIVVGVERLAAPTVARMLGMKSYLVRQQLAGAIWRAAGTGAALMVGLAVLVVMQTQGRTMIGGWKLPDKFPDIFIYRPLGPMSLADTPKIAEVPGIRKDEILPICIASPEFGTNVFLIAGGTALMPNATMFFGVDPSKIFKMMELDFRAGNPIDAEVMLKKGRHILVTEEFRQLKGLTVGDKLPIKTTRHGTVDYTIAGVVWSPGIDVMMGVADPGKQFEQRTAASIFGSINDLKEDFGVDGVLLYAANLEPGVDKTKLLRDIKDHLGVLGLEAGDVRQIKAGIQTFFNDLLLLASSVAFAAMAVSSLGVTNTIMASIRSRRWHFGILRSIGVTRDQLLRMVLAEAILVGFIGCALGLIAGLEMSVNARHLSLVIIGFGPPLVVPWMMIAIGIGVVMIVAIGASIWPAADVARREPLSLLQAGRAAM